MQVKKIEESRQSGLNGFLLTLKVFLPLSIISYFNESVNGYFCMWGGCEPPPVYYHLPRIVAILSALFFVLLAWDKRGHSETHEGSYSWGVFTGTILGVLMFIVLSGIGWVQES